MKTKILLVGIDGLMLRTALDSGRAPMLTGSSHDEHAVTNNYFEGHNLLNRPDLLNLAFCQDRSTTTFAAAGWPPLVDPNGIGPVIHERREQQRASFVICVGIGQDNPNWPDVLPPERLTPLLLDERT